MATHFISRCFDFLICKVGIIEPAVHGLCSVQRTGIFFFKMFLQCVEFKDHSGCRCSEDGVGDYRNQLRSSAACAPRAWEADVVATSLFLVETRQKGPIITRKPGFEGLFL